MIGHCPTATKTQSFLFRGVWSIHHGGTIQKTTNVYLQRHSIHTSQSWRYRARVRVPRSTRIRQHHRAATLEIVIVSEHPHLSYLLGTTEYRAPLLKLAAREIVTNAMLPTTSGSASEETEHLRSLTVPKPYHFNSAPCGTTIAIPISVRSQDKTERSQAQRGCPHYRGGRGWRPRILAPTVMKPLQWLDTHLLPDQFEVQYILEFAMITATTSITTIV
ncbi:hypothetical protein F4678DRAFT_120565 [Xylaria arbuscula]|nr:hypothetical protein F4678DRAFT_120565 [Xylaria arbuscula]